MRIRSLRWLALIGLIGTALLAIVCNRQRVEPVHVDLKQESKVMHFPGRKPSAQPGAGPKIPQARGSKKPSGSLKGARQ